jgi:hypothetical protein
LQLVALHVALVTPGQKAPVR